MPTSELKHDPDSGLFLPAATYVKRFYDRETVVTLPSGERARRWHPEGARSVVQTETDDRLDALVIPKTVAYRLSIRADSTRKA